jgi:hypothetical protein
VPKGKAVWEIIFQAAVFYDVEKIYRRLFQAAWLRRKSAANRA